MTVCGVLHSRAAGPRAGVRRRLHRAYRRGVRTDRGAAAATDVGLDGDEVELDATAGAATVARGVLAAMQQLDTTTSSTTSTTTVAPPTSGPQDPVPDAGPGPEPEQP